MLFISVDDLRPELGTYGAPAHSPNIDRLAAEGVRFDRAYAAVAACAASRASMLSGAYPQTTRVFFMAPALSEGNPRLIPLPRLFKDAGYETVEVGKFLHTEQDAPRAWSQPSWLPPDWDFPQYLAPNNVHMSGIRTAPRGPVSEAPEVPDAAYVDGKIATRAIDELRRMKDRDFFLAVGFVRPHLPFNCPARFWDLYDRDQIEVPDLKGMDSVAKQQWHGNYEPRTYEGGQRIDADTAKRLIHGYRACVSYIDSQVGRLLAELERQELASRTLVVLWGDHGWHLGEHGIWGKHTALEPSLRIPLIVRAPGVAGGVASSGLVESADILPTLCELTGIPDPRQGEGTSFVPLLHDPNRPWKRAAFGLVYRNNTVGQTVRTQRYRFVRWGGWSGDAWEFQAAELYDHQTDPREYRNVANQPENRATVRRLNAWLDTSLAESAKLPSAATVPRDSQRGSTR